MGVNYTGSFWPLFKPFKNEMLVPNFQKIGRKSCNHMNVAQYQLLYPLFVWVLCVAKYCKLNRTFNFQQDRRICTHYPIFVYQFRCMYIHKVLKQVPSERSSGDNKDRCSWHGTRSRSLSDGNRNLSLFPKRLAIVYFTTSVESGLLRIRDHTFKVLDKFCTLSVRDHAKRFRSF